MNNKLESNNETFIRKSVLLSREHHLGSIGQRCKARALISCCGAEAMTVSQHAERLGLVLVASQMHAKRRSCVAGIHI